MSIASAQTYEEYECSVDHFYARSVDDEFTNINLNKRFRIKRRKDTVLVLTKSIDNSEYEDEYKNSN